jgi:hypothetical protein
MDDRDCLAFYPFVVVRIACRVCSTARIVSAGTAGGEIRPGELLTLTLTAPMRGAPVCPGETAPADFRGINSSVAPSAPYLCALLKRMAAHDRSGSYSRQAHLVTDVDDQN